MGILILGRSEIERIKEIISYSEKEENWYLPGRTPIPGDKKEHVFISGTYRAVFSYMAFRGAVYRQLSVSYANPSTLPSLGIMGQLAIDFGFSPSGENWLRGINHEEKTLIYAEKIKDLCSDDRSKKRGR
jgi:hypothetical protein